MRNVRRTTVLLAAVGTLLITATAAQAAAIAPASARLGGLTGGELLGQTFQQIYQLPPSQNPDSNGGVNTCLPIAGGKVLWVWTQPRNASLPTVCTVKPGTPVFTWVDAYSCDSIPSPSYITPAAQRQCIADFFAANPGGSRTISIDGGAPVELISSDYFSFSPQESFVLSPDNIFGVPPQSGTLSVGGYMALIRPLPPGTHSIVDQFSSGIPDQVATVNVVPGYKG